LDGDAAFIERITVTEHVVVAGHIPARPPKLVA
jgi:hypothetical protein